MIKHTFLDKSCTITNGSYTNTGNNPIIELNYGKSVTRALIGFDRGSILDFIRDNGINQENASHYLKMTNCAGVNNDMLNDYLIDYTVSKKDRASSFDIILFRIPQKWDRGVGYEQIKDFWIANRKGVSTQGCNWYNCRNGVKWENGGIYSNSFLQDELDKYNKGEESVIIGKQHFEVGNEDMNIDITSYINSEDENYGIGIAFEPFIENSEEEKGKYVGFFSNRTNTFFHPYIETVYDDYISDDRSDFIAKKDNRLYLSPMDGNEPIEGDVRMEIEGQEFEVKKVRKGVYLAEIKANSLNVNNDTILTDKWTISLENGQEIDIEQEFVAKSDYEILSSFKDMPNIVPIINFSHNNNKFRRDEKYVIEVQYKKKYEFYKHIAPPKKSYYRIYTKNADKQITIFDYQPIDRMGYSGVIELDTSNFVPGQYYMDIRIENNRNQLFNEILKFEIINDGTEKFI